MKKRQVKAYVAALVSVLFLCLFVNADEVKVTMYSIDGRTINIAESAVEDYIKVGWYTEPVTYVYALDGRRLIIKKTAVSDYKKVGWYENEEDIYQYVYSLSGKRYIMKSKVEDWVKVGWSTEEYPLTMVVSFSRTSPENSCIDLHLEVCNTASRCRAISKISFDAYYYSKDGNPMKDIYGNTKISVTYDCPPLNWYSTGRAVTKYFANILDCYRMKICNIKVTYTDGTEETVNAMGYAYLSDK